MGLIEAVATQDSPDAAGYKPLPEGALAIIPLRNMLLFPGIVAPVSFGREASIAAAQDSVKAERSVGFVLQRDPQQDRPAPGDLHWVGSSARILRYITGNEGTHHLVAQGEERFRVLEFLEGWPFLVARIEIVKTLGEEKSPEIQARFHQLRQRAAEALGLLPQAPDELSAVVQNIGSACALADLVGSFLDVKADRKSVV